MRLGAPIDPAPWREHGLESLQRLAEQLDDNDLLRLICRAAELKTEADRLTQCPRP